MHLLWESRTDGEYFELWKILKEFSDNLREYYGTCLLRIIIIDLEGTRHDPSVPRNFRNSCIPSDKKKKKKKNHPYIIQSVLKRNN
jgi:hypothetical protein